MYQKVDGNAFPEGPSEDAEMFAAVLSEEQGEPAEPSPLEDERMAAMTRRFQAGDAEALAELVDASAAYVGRIARQTFCVNIPYQDARQEGMVGLIAAAHNFKAEKLDGIEPADRAKYVRSYFAACIKGCILSADAAASPLAMPQRNYWLARRLARERSRFSTTNKRMPTNHELAEITGVPADNVPALLSALEKPVSLDRAIGHEETGSPSLLEYVPDADAQTALDNAELRVMVDQALAHITPPRTALAVKLYYGVGDDEQDTQTMQEIGTKLGGISRERVRQLLANGESSLRRLLHDQPD